MRLGIWVSTDRWEDVLTICECLWSYKQPWAVISWPGTRDELGIMG